MTTIGRYFRSSRSNDRIPRLAVAILAFGGVLVGLMLEPGLRASSQSIPAEIDIGSSSPVFVESSSGPTSIPLSVTCAIPESDQECELTTTMKFRPTGGTWLSTTQSFDGLQQQLSLPLIDTNRIEYFFEVTEVLTGTTTQYPTGGAASPLSLHVITPMTPVKLDSVSFAEGHPHDTTIRLAWGSEFGQAGLIAGNEGSTIGPQALDVDEKGNVFLLDQINDRIQVFDQTGDVIDAIPVKVGPLGDIALGDDGTIHVLDVVPDGPGSHPVLHSMMPSAQPFSQPLEDAVHVTPEWEPVLIRVKNETVWAYGTPSDAWRPVVGDTPQTALQTGMPSVAGQLLRKVTDSREVAVVPADGKGGPSISLSAPPDRMFGELALVEPMDDGGYLIVVRTWQETPISRDQHEVVRVSDEGQIQQHFAIENGEYAETASLSQFRLGKDGSLYQIWSDVTGLEIRRFDLNTVGEEQ